MKDALQILLGLVAGAVVIGTIGLLAAGTAWGMSGGDMYFAVGAGCLALLVSFVGAIANGQMESEKRRGL